MADAAVEMMKLLLEKGADPNVRISKAAPRRIRCG